MIQGEKEAREWARSQYGEQVLAALDRFADLVRGESERQNLIAASTIPLMWSRHIVDSLQLLQWAPVYVQSWIDIGTGAGFPGMIIAAAFEGRVTLVEPRRKRAEFLEQAARELGFGHVSVQARRAESLTAHHADVISARAVASVEQLLENSRGLAGEQTTYLLPRGMSGVEEVELARCNWHGMFHVKQSITRADSAIIVATGVKPRCSASR